MSIIRSPEARGITILVLIIVVLGFVLAAATGRLEQWFGVTWFSGPRVLDKIVFVSERTGSKQLYVMNPDGSDQKPLTKDASVLSAPAVSPKGNRIAFIGLAEGAGQVFTIGAKGGRPGQITGTSTSKSLPAYSPDGSKLAYIAGGRVYVGEVNGDNPEAVLPTDAEIHAAMSSVESREAPSYRNYAWGPDSKSVAGVTRWGDGNDVLLYLPKFGGEPLPFPQPQNQAKVRIAGIAWAAEEPIMAAAMNIGKDGLLIVFDAGEKSVKAAVPFQGENLGKPAVSPDASRAAVPVNAANANAEGAQASLVVVNLALPTENVIAAGRFENPAYSPDGDTILAVRVEDAGKKRNIVSIDALTGKVKQLTDDGSSFDAAWTPASEK